MIPQINVPYSIKNTRANFLPAHYVSTASWDYEVTASRFAEVHQQNNTFVHIPVLVSLLTLGITLVRTPSFDYHVSQLCKQSFLHNYSSVMSYTPLWPLS
jgi:hypothetical protein